MSRLISPTFLTPVVLSLLMHGVLADERDDRIQSLERRVEQLEKLLQARESGPPSPADASKSVAPAKAGPTLSVGSSGFALRSADTNFTLRLRGLINADSRWYPDDGGIHDNDGFFLRRVRPIIEGTLFRDFEFRFTPEFGGSSPVIRDAWINFHHGDGLQFTIGKMKPPGGLERWQSVANVLFVERSLVSGLWPVRDLGVLLHGDL